MDIDLSRVKHTTVRIEHHKATTKVGRDTIEADYSVLEYEPCFECSYTLWDKITLPMYRIKHKIKHVYWEIRYGFQRMFKGYDYVDTFEVFAKFIERYTKILTEFKNDLHGYPGTLTSDEWDNILDEMLYHLHYMDEDNVIKELEKDVPKEWCADLNTVGEVMTKHKDEFFKLFSEYFYNLWD